MKGLTSNIFSYSKEFFLITLGIFIEAFGLKSFLIPNGVIDGGITGISLLISFVTPLSVSLLIFLINIPFVFLARKQMGNTFALKTFLAIVGLSIVLIFVDFPIITSDKLLAIVFGGFMVGAGTGLAIRGSCVIDGTEVLSIYLNKKFGLSMGEIIFVLNAIIFSVASVLLSIEAALYSVLTYLAASKTIDFFVQGIEEYIGLTVISNKSENIRKMLVIDAGKGVTIYKGKGGYHQNDKKETDILYTFVTRLEVVKIKQKILATDPNAVIIEQGIHEIHGGIVKKKTSALNLYYSVRFHNLYNLAHLLLFVIDRFSKFSPLILRIGIAGVFLWFGFSQLSNPSQWTGMIPSYASLIPISSANLIYFHGIFEIACSVLLLLGLYTRLASALLALNLIHITLLVGYGPIGARDFALTLTTLAIFFNGSDDYTLDKYIDNREVKY